jgi:hypothetical protein
MDECQALVRGHFLPKNVGGMLLSAILSDTLNMRSPTTTEWQGLTLIHFSAQREHFLRRRGCI